jgi:hypothetical protein
VHDIWEKGSGGILTVCCVTGRGFEMKLSDLIKELQMYIDIKNKATKMFVLDSVDIRMINIGYIELRNLAIRKGIKYCPIGRVLISDILSNEKIASSLFQTWINRATQHIEEFGSPKKLDTLEDNEIKKKVMERAQLEKWETLLEELNIAYSQYKKHRITNFPLKVGTVCYVKLTEGESDCDKCIGLSMGIVVSAHLNYAMIHIGTEELKFELADNTGWVFNNSKKVRHRILLQDYQRSEETEALKDFILNRRTY